MQLSDVIVRNARGRADLAELMDDGYPIVTLFGSLSIRAANGGWRTSLSGSAGEVFAYLVTNSGRGVRRERLADLFWTEAEPARARAALNTAVWRINKALARLKGIELRSGGDQLMLETSPETRIDARLLESAVRAASGPERSEPLDPTVRAALAEAVDEHRGPFLDGSASDWAIVERERLNALHLRGLGILMQDAALRRDYEDALGYGRRILAADPFRERVQCEVMWLYVLNGQRPQAMRQFEAFRRLILREMSVAPMAETRALAEYIRRGSEVDLDFEILRELATETDPVRRLRDLAERSRLEAYRASARPAP
jgi:DNA-binding SARP family transcriptional activator